MPYDNKQCKSYKALKIKYAGYKLDENDNLQVFDWNNDTQNVAGVSSLIDLSTVKSYINPSGWPTLIDTLKNQNVQYYYDKDVIFDATSSMLMKMNYKFYLNQLSPTNWSIQDLENQDEPDDKQVFSETYNNLTSAQVKLDSIIKYCTVPVKGHNKSISGIMELDAYTKITGYLSGINDELSVIATSGIPIEIINQISNQLLVDDYPLTGIVDIYETIAVQFDKLSANVQPRSVVGLLDAAKDSTSTVSSAVQTLIDKGWQNQTLVTKFSEFFTNFGKARDIIIKYNLSLNESDNENLAEAILNQYDYLNTYLIEGGPSHDKTTVGVYNLLTSGATSAMFTNLASSTVLTYELSGTFKNGTEIQPIADNITGTITLSEMMTYLSGIPNIGTTVTLIDSTTKIPFNSLSGQLFNHTQQYQGYIPDAVSAYIICPSDNNHNWSEDTSVWTNIRKIGIEHTKQCLIQSNAIKKNARLLINGKSPFGLNLNEDIISDVLTGSYEKSLSAFISDISGQTNKNIKSLDKALAQIYNDPYFKKYDGTLKGQAIVDAALLTDPAVDYDYCVYLDSKECTISNEQYDDLVVGNTFTKADRQVSKYGEDIDSANFIIVDKTKSIVNGVGGNNGMFVTVVDPYDALKFQRLLANPENARTLNENLNKNSIQYLGAESDYAWKTMFKTEINTLNALQRVKNADGLWVGEVNTVPGKEQLMDSWSTPLSDVYENVSISKSLMGMFPQIPLTDTGKSGEICTIDKQYSSFIIVAVCKTMVNPTDGKITVGVVETFFGSLFDETNPQTGADLFIGNIINANSKYVEFYKNHYVAPQDVYMPIVASVPQFYIKDSAELNNACKFVGIDQDSYDVDNIYFDAEGKRLPSCPPEVVYNYNQYIKAINAANIFVFNKKTTILYNNHPYAEFSSFSKKESQKVIADTTGLYGKEMGTTLNIANNFMKDMDRCINFIKNIDAIPIYFITDAGLSTIAQFCDNVSWDKGGNNGYGKWVTQNFDPDNDPDSEDRYITDYTSVATWRKIVDKLDQISREIRKDCMTIIDAPRQLTLDGAAPKIRKSRPDRSWNDVIGEKLIYISGINSSYTAGYYNWLRTTDTFTGKSFWLPPTCKIIGNYMYLNIVNLPWLAPAGHSYGIIPGIHSLSHNPDPNEEDQIYLKSWNYVKQYPFEGFIIEGQKTTLTKNSAFNRVNVRTLFLDLERFTYNVSKRFKYTVNNSYTREQFVQTLKPKFDDYVARGGIYDYRIICDDSNNTPETIDANELRCAIYIKPARLIEYILIDFVCTKTGANLDEIVL